MSMKERFTARIDAAIHGIRGIHGIAVAEPVGHGPDWVHTRFAVHDETYPLVVDVVASTTIQPSRVVYMLPGGGLNFDCNFFTPRDRNIAHFLRHHGYLVVG